MNHPFRVASSLFVALALGSLAACDSDDPAAATPPAGGSAGASAGAGGGVAGSGGARAGAGGAAGNSAGAAGSAGSSAGAGGAAGTSAGAAGASAGAAGASAGAAGATAGAAGASAGAAGASAGAGGASAGAAGSAGATAGSAGTTAGAAGASAGAAGSAGASGGAAGASAGSAGSAGSSAGSAGAASACSLAAAPVCNTMNVPAAATFVQGTVGTVPAVAGGGIIPPGTYYLIKQIVGSGTPVNKKIASSGDGLCLTAIEVSPDNTEARFSGTATYVGEKSTTTITCPVSVVLEPTFQVLAPIGGKVHYATLAPGGNDYREWLQELVGAGWRGMWTSHGSRGIPNKYLTMA